MKKFISLLLVFLMLISCTSVAFAAPIDSGILKFDQNGQFKILNICDIQEHYPMYTTTKTFIVDMIKKHNPDIVVLGGDNTVGPKETKALAVKELCDIFVENDTYFTFVFGNHDDEQGVSREELFAMYKLYGGQYCLAYDAVPALSGCGTHNLPVLSSDSSKVAFNLYMFDSNSYVYNDKGDRLGYDCVREDQINWYKNTSNALKLLNGGKPVPSMAFQHIIVQEAYDKLFLSSHNLGALTQNFDKVSYSYLPTLHGIKNGLIFEAPCCGYYNFGQFDAMVEQDDVVAIFSGHDHVNSFTVTHKGIDIVNTPGCGFKAYGKDVVRGIRLLTINENNPENYDSKLLTVADYVLEDGAYLADLGQISVFNAQIARITRTLCNFIVSFFGLFKFSN